MPSRKKAQGKTRARKKAIQDKRGNTIHLLFDDLSLTKNMSPLFQNNGKCSHGCDLSLYAVDDVCLQFLRHIERELFFAFHDENRVQGLCATANAIMVHFAKDPRYIQIWSDKEEQERLMPLLLSLGTELILKQEPQPLFTNMASVLAVVAIHLEHSFDHAQAMRQRSSRMMLRDFNQGGHAGDAIRFFMKRCPCSCLRSKHRDEKSKVKRARCDNPLCHLKKDRRELFICGSCCFNTYCGQICQAADYNRHKSDCKAWQRG